MRMAWKVAFLLVCLLLATFVVEAAKKKKTASTVTADSAKVRVQKL